jgi:Anti-sigma factor NepR
LTFPEDKKGGDETKPQSEVRASHVTPERRGRRRPPAGEVGQALRSVYDRALNEEIPPEMLDLLGKLG